MRSSLRSQDAPADSPAWFDAEQSRLGWPSWLLSSLFHGLFLALMVLLSQSKGCQPDSLGEGGESFRPVGVYVTSGETDAEPPPSEEHEPSPQTAAAAPLAVDVTDPPLLDGPPIPLSRPQTSQPSVLGLGAPPSLTGTRAASPSLATSAVTGPPPGTSSALGGATSLFGISDAGRRFAYVFDRSGSMSDYGAIHVAKAELMASLERLDTTQEFQVIFYSKDPIAILPRSGKSDMFRGVDTHRLEVRRQVELIQPDGGTDHMPALQLALRTNPDVVFFLTDADEPELTAEQLADIKRRNGGGARIHCIEFGQGPSLQSARGPKNFLQKLAEQNDGQYQYRDVTRFH